MRALVLLIAAHLVMGCGGEPQLLIELERPSGALDPLKDKRLSKFSLRLVQGKQTTTQEAFRGGDTELAVGTVPVDSPFDLRLAGRSASGLMVGLGQVLDLTVSDSEITRVSIKFRKPLGYVTGQNQVLTLDAAATTSGQLELNPVQVSGGTGVAAMRNGVVMLVTSGASLIPIRTADHVRLTPIKLSSSGSCVGVSRDNRRALICHPAAKTVGVVDLAAIGTAQAKESTLKVTGTPSKVVFSRDKRRALVLMDAKSHRTACPGGNSSVVEVDLLSGKTQPAKSLGAPIADIALDPRDESLLLVLPCQNKLRMSRGGVKVQEVDIPTTHDLAASDQNFVLVGRAPGASVKGQAVLFDLTKGSGLSSRQNKGFSMAPIVIRLTSSGSTSGYYGWASEAQSLDIYDLEISPDSQRAIGLFEAQFSSSMTFDACSYRAKLKAVGYLLVDLDAGSVLVRRFTRLTFTDCYANCVVNPKNQRLTTQSVCATEFKRVMRQYGDLISGTAEFDPAGATMLFGGS